MKNTLIKLTDLTENDIKIKENFLKKRFLYNKYTIEELKDWTKVDLYEALDLDGMRYDDISLDVLNYVTKQKFFMYHPCRNGGKNEAFHLISTAKKLFSVPKYKKLYDSVTLDESIPEDKEYNLQEFLEAFTPCFERNAIFSEIKPVPKLSENLENFYKFWFNFKSNRIYEDPEDVFEQSGSTRKYHAENKKDIIAKRKEKDAKRIHSLVRLAYIRDPRIKRISISTKPWTENETKSLVKFNMLLGKHKDKYNELAKKLNKMFLSNRSVSEIKTKLETLKKK